MSVKIYSFAKDGNTDLSAHFKVREFKSFNDATGKLTGDEIKIDENLPRALEKIFAALNCSKIIITSGYRSPDFEAYLSKGKTTTGQHVIGTAADIICFNQAGGKIDPKQVCCTAQDLGMTGIGFMAGGTHIDVRASRSWFDETKNNTVVSDWYSYFGITKPQAAAPAPAPAPALAHKVGENVVFSTCYASSTDSTDKAIQASKMQRNHGTITKIYPGAHNPYLLDGSLCFVNDGDIRGPYSASGPAPAPAPAAPAEKTYTVQSGDSFWKIASTQMGNGNKYKELAEYNELKPTDTIYKGQVLKIPQ